MLDVSDKILTFNEMLSLWEEDIKNMSVIFQ